MIRTLVILLLLCTAATAQQQQAPTVYYDPATGQDTNPGTKDKPLKTMDKALEVLGPQAGQIVSPLGTTTFTGAKRFTPPTTPAR